MPGARRTAAKGGGGVKAGDVFFAGDYAERLANGTETLPKEATEGPYALGSIIMVSRKSFAHDYVLHDIPAWFPARVCLPPAVPGQWYRWYDPFIWYETEIPIHLPTDHTPENMGYVGKVWYDGKPSEWFNPYSFWAYPVQKWAELFSEAQP